MYKKLNFKNRKKIHYSLLACIIALQILAIIVWYNETVNEEKLMQNIEDNRFAEAVNEQSGNVISGIILSQNYFNDYIQTKNKSALDSYLKSVADIKPLIDGLLKDTKTNENFNKIWNKKTSAEKNILNISSTIDSIIETQNFPDLDKVSKPVVFSPFLFNNVLDSIQSQTYVSMDSVAKKGLIQRLAAALSGKMEVQKEHSNTIVTLKYKNQVKSGTIEEQLKFLSKISNNYYKNEFNKLKNFFSILREKDLELAKLNNELLLLAQTTLPDLSKSINTFSTESHNAVKKQLAINKAIRSYSVVALLILMIIVSVLLFGLTQLSFEYEKRLTDAQEKINQNLSFKNRIIGMISHEIRSPLSIISIYSNKISQSIQEPDVKETFDSIKFTTNSLLTLSNQILEYSKDEQQKLTLKNKNFFLTTELKQIITAMKSLVENNDNKLLVTMNAKNDEEVYTDIAKIHQLFYNIIGNANKFTKKGTIKVNINQTEISDFELLLDVVIQDNGEGISKDDLGKIFDAHYQVESTVHHLGIGLGLNLCKEIINLMEGEITVESEKKRGTKVAFQLTLPRA